MKISIIAPCFNEEGNLRNLHQRILNSFISTGINFELLLIDDGSTDSTWDVITDLSKTGYVVGIKNSTNIGIFRSWKLGLTRASGDLVCLIDSDLQNPPEAIIKLLEKYQFENCHIVQGTRSSIEWHRDSRYYSSRGLNFLLNIFFNDSAKDNKSGFILTSKTILQDVLNFKKKYYFPNTFIRISARSKGYQISELETLFQPRKSGQSFLSNKSIFFTYVKVLTDIVKAMQEFGRGVKHPIEAILKQYTHSLHSEIEHNWVRKLIITTYFKTMPLHAWLIRPETKLTFYTLRQTQWLEKSEILEMQNWRLQRLIWHIYKFVPYYQRLFINNGIHPRDIETIHDLSKIPLLSKESVSNNLYMDLFSENHNKKEMHKISTSGSTGQPFVTYADRQQLEVRFASTLRSLEWTGWQFGDKQVRLWHQNLGMSPSQVFREKLDAKLLRRKFVPAFEMTESSLKGLVKTLNSYRPVLIDGYAESLNFLALYASSGGSFKFRPKGILSSAQMLTVKTREQIENSFNAKVFDKYGAREFSGIAYQCEKLSVNHHIMDESYIVEILKNGRPARPGELGEVVITDLNNFSFPLVRYRIGDLAIAVDKNKPCECGRGLSQIGEIQGRTQALVYCANGRWLPGTFFAHFFKDYEHLVRYFQVIQEEKNAFLLKIVKGSAWNLGDWEDLVTSLREFVGQTRIEIDYVHEIPLIVTGKRTPVLSKIKLDFQTML